MDGVSGNKMIKPAIQTSETGFAQAIKTYEDGTEEVRSYLIKECDILYECIFCRNIFRRLTEFIVHKRTFCEQKFVDTDPAIIKQIKHDYLNEDNLCNKNMRDINRVLHKLAVNKNETMTLTQHYNRAISKEEHEKKCEHTDSNRNGKNSRISLRTKRAKRETIIKRGVRTNKVKEMTPHREVIPAQTDKEREAICVYCKKTFKRRAILSSHLKICSTKHNSNNHCNNNKKKNNNNKPKLLNKTIIEDDLVYDSIEDDWTKDNVSFNREKNFLCSKCTYSAFRKIDVTNHLRITHKLTGDASELGASIVIKKLIKKRKTREVKTNLRFNEALEKLQITTISDVTIKSENDQKNESPPAFECISSSVGTTNASMTPMAMTTKIFKTMPLNANQYEIGDAKLLPTTTISTESTLSSSTALVASSNILRDDADSYKENGGIVPLSLRTHKRRSTMQQHQRTSYSVSKLSANLSPLQILLPTSTNARIS